MQPRLRRRFCPQDCAIKYNQPMYRKSVLEEPMRKNQKALVKLFTPF